MTPGTNQYIFYLKTYSNLFIAKLGINREEIWLEISSTLSTIHCHSFFLQAAFTNAVYSVGTSIQLPCPLIMTQSTEQANFQQKSSHNETRKVYLI